MSPYRWLAALPLAATLAGSAMAGPLTFAEALDRAQTAVPSLQAASLIADAARASARSAGALPDPKLGLSLENLPVTGPNAGRLGADEMTMARVGLQQDVPNAARRRAAHVEASAAISEAEAMRLAEARRVKLGAALAWIDLAYAERRLAALDHVLRSLAPVWDAQPSAVASGRARPAQALTPVAMRAALEDRRSEQTAAVARARAQLTRWTGEPGPSTAGAAPDFEIDPVALQDGLEDVPALVASRAAIARADAAVGAARAAKRPDLGFEVAYGRRDPRFGDMLTAGVTVSLPLWPGSRQEPQIAARRAEAASARATVEDARRALAAQFEADWADHIMHHDQWHRTVAIVLPAAQQRADLETASYAAGTAGLPDILDAFSALAEAKLTALDREALVARDAARIVLTYGSAQ
ncbi:TolC family protein [Phenylobacterium sp.]|uniref:TolC family protein n=1 Tax=Phenylobacterium sp. TaxID=1871053 RepID=UPI0025D092EF|nr:TolC family protein [Phenylobacterium sp.]